MIFLQGQFSQIPLLIRGSFELKITTLLDDSFGNEFYEKLKLQKCTYIRDKSSCSYVGRIDGIEMITNGIKLTLQPILGEVDGSIYYNNQYEVSIGYNRYGLNTHSNDY